MDKNIVEYRKERDKLLEKKSYNVEVTNRFDDWDGMHIWYFNVRLMKLEETKEEHIPKACISGCFIPRSTAFDRNLFFPCILELCDSISSDMLAAYDVIYDMDEINESLRLKLGLDEVETYDTEVMYIDHIAYEDLEELSFLLDCMDIIKEGTPADNCTIAAAIFHKEKEQAAITVFKEHGWILEEMDGSGIMAFLNIA